MAFNLFAATGVSNYATDTFISVLFVIATVATLAVAVWLLVKFANLSKGQANLVKILAIIVGVGVILRIVFALLITGNRMDHSIIYSAITHWTKYGPKTYIERNYFKAGEYLYPISFYVFGFLGGTAVNLGLDQSSVAVQLIVKLPLIIADVFTAIVIYKAGKRFINEYVGVVLAAIVMICPVFIFASSVWGSVYSLFLPFVVASFYFLATKKYVFSIALYALSMLVVREASYLFPIFLIYYAYACVRSVVDYKNSGNKDDLSNVIAIPATVIVMTIVNYLICLPITASHSGGNFFSYVYEIYLNPLVNFRYFANNSLSIYNILMKGGVGVDILFPNVIFTVLFAVVVTAFAAVIYLARRNRAVVALGGAYLFFLLNTCYVDFSAPAVVLILPLLLLAFVFIKDKRILKIFAAESVLAIINMSAVFVYGGYYNSLDPSAFSTNNYTGTPIMANTVSGLVISIVLSVLSIAVCLYFTKVVMDIAMSNKCRYLGGNDRIDFGSAIKDFIRL